MCITAGERGREDLWSALRLLGRSAPTSEKQGWGGLVSLPQLCVTHLPAHVQPEDLLTQAQSGNTTKKEAGQLLSLEETRWDGVVGCLPDCMGSNGREAPSGEASCGAVSGSPKHHVPVGLTDPSKHSTGMTLITYRQRQETCT